MGVHGITKFLEERGLLPANSFDECCSTKLWKEWSPSMAFRETTSGPALQVLPPKSKLLIDGNGLAFHLYHVAYARHIQSTFPSRTSGSCPMVKSLSASDITKAIPCMMPLELVRQVAVEFATTLSQQDLTLQCFWDGPAHHQRFKAKTIRKRTLQRQQDWAALQTFCRHGTLPLKPTDTACQCIWHFPLSRLFLLSVKQALQTCSIDMVQCIDEADMQLARVASGDPDAFVLGQDSDFLFYKDIQYVPFGGIYMPSTTTNISGGRGNNIRVQVVCLTRSNIAGAIGLDDEDMVELAILLGNDYVDPKTSLSLPNFADLRNVEDRIAYLQQQLQQSDGNCYKSSPELDYVRAMYNLDDMESFPLNSEEEDDYNDNDDSSNATTDDRKAEQDPLEQLEERVISFPGDFPLDQAVMLPTDTSVQSVVVRCLQTYIDQSYANEGHDDDGDCAGRKAPLQQAHLDAYKAATLPSISSSLFRLAGRPRWSNIRAAFIIDICIARVLNASGSSSLFARQTPPSSLMNHLRFHAVLATLQADQEDEDTDNGPANIATQSTRDSPEIVERPTLPIDEHQETILDTIERNRVTIIHGETGCGKSSRVPVMILEAPSPEPTLPSIKMFISQPRRIAAASLVERVRSCEPKHRDKFAVRMGHGYREYESGKTQAWFVTTGYLTRLLANHPERFNDVTHLIIDEVHERSVDTDILCLLCRRLLESNTTIRLVLMSATLATKLYKDYFQVPSDPIHVGVRRFPIQEFFVEELHAKFKLPPNELQTAKAIQKECESRRCNSAPTQTELSNRFSLAARLTTIVGSPGSSVLVFVPGMGEILAITEAIEKLYRTGVTYTCFPIHSDVPFEEQMGAFDAPGADEVKVIIATNAAESSVTLPAVDHVICLGLCRQIMYNEASHRQILMPCWISKASATQRAGRTGRVRPGNVYRLYTRHAYEQYMDEFEQGEMVRIPLDSVILMLKDMLHEEVKPVLMNCIEPPRMETIDKSFASLHQWSFLSEPSDTAEITNLGSFVTALGIDLALGSFIGLGIQFGVAAEAIEMAAVMSFPKSPFQMSNPLFHAPGKFNEIASKTYVSKCHFDANLYSEPLGLMNALWDHHMASDKGRFCTYYRFAHMRMGQLQSTRNSLRKRVATFLGINEDKLQVHSPPVHMPHYKLTILRILKAWVFSDTIVECLPTKMAQSPNGSVSLSVPRKEVLSEKLLDQVLDKDRHPYMIVESRNVEALGDFEHEGGDFSLQQSIHALQCRLLSYMCETGIDAAILKDNEQTFIYLRNEATSKPTLTGMFELGACFGESDRLLAEFDPDIKRRGVLERKCGLWKVSCLSGATVEQPSCDGDTQRCVFRRLSHSNGGLSLDSFIQQAIKKEEITSMLSFHFLSGKKKKKKIDSSRQQFQYIQKGAAFQSMISKLDMQDLLSTSSFQVLSTKESNTQSINFSHHENRPFPFKGKGKDLMATSLDSELSSWRRPLLIDIPEGARVLSVLASGQRRGGHRLRFPNGGADEESDSSIDVFLVQDETCIGKRWHRLASGKQVFVQEDSVPASATTGKFPIFACCANALELKGGGMKVEGMTLLPPNPLFLLLCRLSFGLGPEVDVNFGSTAQEKSPANVSATSLQWLKTRMRDLSTGTEENVDSVAALPFEYNETESKQKIDMAFRFHESCSTLGEALVCFPDKAKALCKLFNGLDGYDTTPPDDFEETAITLENLTAWQKEKKSTYLSIPAASKGSSSGPKKAKEGPVKSSTARSTKSISAPPGSIVGTTSVKGNPVLKWRILRTFDMEVQAKARSLFATTLDAGEQLSISDFPSTNILALLVHEFASSVLSPGESTEQIRSEQCSVGLNSNNWEITVHEDESGKLLYQAQFTNSLLPHTKIFGRGKNKLPKWMKKHFRPHRIEDAKACVPPTVVCPEPRIVFLSKDRPTLAFEDIASALRMEAAFYLERQFAVAGKNSCRHWFDHGLHEMLAILVKIAGEKELA